MLRIAMQKIIPHLPIGLIMLVAAVLRLWNVFNIPFTHDEYSSMLRADHDSVGAMIQHGIITDTHPPLSQFIYYVLMHTGGKHELWIKWPYLLMGIASVWLLYRIGVRWFNATSGLLAASFFAVLQECVMHSQIARPYALGCFLILCAAHLLTSSLYSSKPFRWWQIITTGIVLALCALSHHFCMLAAFLLFTGFCVIVGKAKWKHAMWIAVVALLCYAPNLFILKYQLAQGGIGTVVSKPDAGFLLNYFHYLFHFSWWMLAMVALLLVVSVFRWNGLHKWKWQLFAGSIFLLSYVAGHFYSSYVAPVMHFRVLYFALPFFLLFLFSFIKLVSGKWQLILISCVLSVGACSLVAERFHYRIFYTSGYEGVWESTAEAASLAKKSRSMLAYTPYMFAYQNKSHGLDLINTNPDSSWTMNDYVHFFDTCGASQFSMGFTMQYYKPPVEVLGMLAEKYGHIAVHHNYFNSWYYCFDFLGSHLPNHLRLSEDDCRYLRSAKLTNANSADALHLGPHDEYGYECSFDLPHANVNYCDWVVATALVQADSLCNALLVLEVFQNGKSMHWQAGEMKNFRMDNQTITRIYTGLYSPDVLKKDEPYTIKAYLWNKNDSMEVADLHFDIIPGNPMMYSLQAPVHAADLAKLP
ncbi:MAG: glycosyltransferase family 39 protein [Flavobacteriales bacterium]